MSTLFEAKVGLLQPSLFIQFSNSEIYRPDSFFEVLSPALLTVISVDFQGNVGHLEGGHRLAGHSYPHSLMGKLDSCRLLSSSNSATQKSSVQIQFYRSRAALSTMIMEELKGNVGHFSGSHRLAGHSYPHPLMRKLDSCRLLASSNSATQKSTVQIQFSRYRDQPSQP